MFGFKFSQSPFIGLSDPVLPHLRVLLFHLPLFFLLIDPVAFLENPKFGKGEFVERSRADVLIPLLVEEVDEARFPFGLSQFPSSNSRSPSSLKLMF